MKNIKGNDTCYLEFASSKESGIIELLSIIGKHAYNKNVIVGGKESVALIIE